MKTILQINQERAAIADRQARFEVYVRDHREQWKRELAELAEDEHALIENLDVSLITMARGILEVRGLEHFSVSEYNMHSGEFADNAMILQIVDDIFAGCRALSVAYFGVKDYAGFTHQGIRCEYGMGPKHGSVVWSVGLKEQYRETGLLAAQQEAVIYFLTCVRKGLWPMKQKAAS